MFTWLYALYTFCNYLYYRYPKSPYKGRTALSAYKWSITFLSLSIPFLPLPYETILTLVGFYVGFGNNLHIAEILFAAALVYLLFRYMRRFGREKLSVRLSKALFTSGFESVTLLFPIATGLMAITVFLFAPHNEQLIWQVRLFSIGVFCLNAWLQSLANRISGNFGRLGI